MRWRTFAFIFCVMFAFAIVEAPARPASPPEATIQGLYAALIDTMKRGSQLGQSGRYDVLEPAIRRSFDLRAMAQRAVGLSWERLSTGDQERVTDAFARYTIATYASRFDDYSGEKFDVTGQRSVPYGTIIESRIAEPNGEPIRIDYLMRQNGEDWRIADVYLTGAVSQLATLRSQFSAVLAGRGVEGLIDTLNRKAAALATKSF